MPELLRVVACGSVDDGKSTLIGRLLAETLSVPEDILEAARWTRRTGSLIPAGEIDYSLLTDGLEAEREQGITIDVAYRHLQLPDGKRAILADAPGHEQFTRNMAVAASTADVAILLLDAVRGVRPQSFRHLRICALMGVPTVIVAVNKMEVSGFDQAVFDDVVAQVARSAREAGVAAVFTLPVSALRGDFVTERGEGAPWYSGPTLLELLQSVGAAAPAESDRLRLPIQLVLRSEGGRTYAGTILAGRVRIGDDVRVGRTNARARVSGLTVAGRAADYATAGLAVGLQLDRELDCSRGDLLLASEDPRRPNDRYVAELIWLSEAPLARGRSYDFVSGPTGTGVSITRVRDRLEVESGHRHAAQELTCNDIGSVEIATDSPVVLDPYQELRDTGSFLLVDRRSGETAAAGLVLHELRRGANVHEQSFDISRGDRARRLGHPAKVLWFTGLSGAGKSTIAGSVERLLAERGVNTYVLDGDNLRLGLNKDLGFTPQDRAENVRRVGEVARLMFDAGLVVLVSLVSPYQVDRDAVRSLFQEGDFAEIHVNTPLAVCRERDPKGLYGLAARGDIPNLTGVGQDYEPPANPELAVAGEGEPRDVARVVVERFFG